VHFDLRIVMELLQQTIAEKRTNQRFILIEGLCNSNKLASEDAQLELRFMDEIFAIEKCLGEVDSCVSLTFCQENKPDPAETKYEEYEEEVVVEKEVKLDEEGNPIPEEVPEEDPEAPKKVKFNPKDFQGEGKAGWTITDKKSKNLLTLFASMKGTKAQADLRDAENYSKQHY